MEKKKTPTVREWADDDKPREKLLKHGKKQLSNVELVAILLRSGMKGKNVIEVAREVLSLAGNSLITLSRMEHSELDSVKGMATAKSTSLIAALELGWRMQGEIEAENKIVIHDSKDLFNYMFPLVIDLDHEEFWIVYLNGQNRVLGRQRISMGGQTETLVDLRILFRGAIENKAINISVAHNHPSGLIKPSRQDLVLTKHIAEAGKILGIKLVEHIIIGIPNKGKDCYFSFNDNQML